MRAVCQRLGEREISRLLANTLNPEPTVQVVVGQTSTPDYAYGPVEVLGGGRFLMSEVPLYHAGGCGAGVAGPKVVQVLQVNPTPQTSSSQPSTVNSGVRNSSPAP